MYLRGQVKYVFIAEDSEYTFSVSVKRRVNFAFILLIGSNGLPFVPFVLFLGLT